MTYKITSYTRNKARSLNVVVKPSTRKGKKIDVYKNNKKVASIGAAGMNDYPTYIRTKGLEYAKKRRILYRKRHAKELKATGTPGYYAAKLLW